MDQVDQETLDNIKVENFDGIEDLVGDDEKLKEMLNKLLADTKEATASARAGQLISIHWSVYLVAFVIIIGTIGTLTYLNNNLLYNYPLGLYLIIQHQAK